MATSIVGYLTSPFTRTRQDHIAEGNNPSIFPPEFPVFTFQFRAREPSGSCVAASSGVAVLQAPGRALGRSLCPTASRNGILNRGKLVELSSTRLSVTV